MREILVPLFVEIVIQNQNSTIELRELFAKERAVSTARENSPLARAAHN
jgi:hypothetical protein